MMINKSFIYAALLSSSLLSTGCMTTPTLPVDQRPAEWGQQIQKASNFYKISDVVYRSEQPSAELILELKI